MSILCYHSVEPGWESPLAVAPDAFAGQCLWLSRRRRVVPLEDAVRLLDRSFRLPRGAAAITFDDGFAALYDHALPALRRHSLPATVFLVAATLTPGAHPVDWIDAPPPRPPATLTIDQILEMQEAGIAFGSHSWAHRLLPTLTEEECFRDLRESRGFLEEILGRKVPFLAYPRGRHDARVRRSAERAGYSHSFSLPETAERAGPHAVPRVGIYRGNSRLALSIKSARWYLPVRTSRAFATVRRRPPQGS